MEDLEGRKQFEAEEVGTPYRRAKEVIDSRVGSARKQAYNWRLFALGMVGVVVLSVGGLIWQSMKSQVEPYVVEVGKEGRVRLVGKPEAKPYRPEEAVRKSVVEEWVMDVRRRPADKKVLKQQLMDAYERVTGGAKGHLDSMLDQESPFEFIQAKRRTVSMATVNKVGEGSYRLEWVEKMRNRDGYQMGTREYVGIVDLEFREAGTAQELKKNPLGLYVTHFSINRRANLSEEE
jgi:type IV secretion system protein VirB5